MHTHTFTNAAKRSKVAIRKLDSAMAFSYFIGKKASAQIFVGIDKIAL